MTHRDEVDEVVDSWSRERPDLDTSPMLVFSRITRLSKRLGTYRQAAFERSQLDTWEFDVLAVLRRSGDPHRESTKTLVTETMVSSGTMTNRIDRLVERGLVVRQTDPNDGRGVLVELTADGLARVDAAMTRLVDAEEELLRTLSAPERERLAVLLRKLRTGFDD